MFSTSSVNVIGFDPNRSLWPLNGCAVIAIAYMRKGGCRGPGGKVTPTKPVLMRANIVPSQRSGALMTEYVFCIYLAIFGVPPYRYYMETTAPKSDDNDQNQLKKWLMARTVGLPTAWNRLLNFHFVRSTKAVVYTPHVFVQDSGAGYASLRTAEHLVKYPEYPDPMY